jgi:phosphatidylglycerophosphatase A
MLLWIAQGFGIGRAPFSPGTFGSALGILWFGLLLQTGGFPGFLIGIVLSLGLSVWLCGEGEKILKRPDPGSVVMDEIVAIPICFTAWVTILYRQSGQWPAFASFFTPEHWPVTLGIFLAFRFFDIAKPWPVKQSQVLPGGWGITVDDLLAAIYVNLVTLVVYLIKPALLR